jgi:hypothetical protein
MVFWDEPRDDTPDWLVAAGIREEGAPGDFYAALHAQAHAARQRYNAEHDKPLTTDTYAEPLLPGPDDRDRYLIEAGARLARHLNAVLHQFVAGSLRDGAHILCPEG